MQLIQFPQYNNNYNNNNYYNNSNNYINTANNDKKHRRSKHEQEGRDFPCNCGKSFLSQAALNSHIRNKHPELLKAKKNVGVAAHVNILRMRTFLKRPNLKAFF